MNEHTTQPREQNYEIPRGRNGDSGKILVHISPDGIITTRVEKILNGTVLLGPPETIEHRYLRRLITDAQNAIECAERQARIITTEQTGLEALQRLYDNSTTTTPDPH